ncbi:MAG TPA: hypothetical protein VM577_02410 [Anaerovoracaceae bacterium]|nr:hypothetical protein [Anaerovoracaceae bacterium]
MAVEINKSEICDFFAQVRQQFALQIGRANVRKFSTVENFLRMRYNKKIVIIILKKDVINLI